MSTSVRRVLVLYGTRPEVIKMAPVVAALGRQPGIEVIVGSTGQHREMLDQAHALFGLRPDFDLGLMRPNQSLNDLTARAIAALDGVLVEHQPDWLLVQGDTTTAMAGALAAFHRRVRIGHIEAGLRTGDLAQPFPEEANRRLIDVLAGALFAPTARAAATLQAEGCPSERVFLVGNTVIDAVRMVTSSEPAPAPCERRMVLITVHRRESFGEPLHEILAAIQELATRFPEVDWLYPVHPNPNVHGPAHATLGGLANLRLVAPLDYPALLTALRGSHMVLTDSGGIQEEAPAFGRPVLVLRDTTERPEGVDAGVARLVGTDRGRIVAAASELLTDPAAHAAMARADNPYGDGFAAERIAAILAGAPWQPFAGSTPAPAGPISTRSQPPHNDDAEEAWSTAARAGREAMALRRQRDDLAARLHRLESTRLVKASHRLWALTARLAPAGGARRALLRGLRSTTVAGGSTAMSPPQPEPPLPSELRAELAAFVDRVVAQRPDRVLVVLAGTRFSRDNAQRPAQLATAAAARGIPVVFGYFRWQPDDWAPADNDILQVPLDLLGLWGDLLQPLTVLAQPILLCCWPYPGLVTLLEQKQAAGWTTIYDVLDDWDAFQQAGWAPWYDQEVERLVARTVGHLVAVSRALATQIEGLASRPVTIIGNGWRDDILAASTRRSLRRGDVTVGYFGDLSSAWFDWELVTAAARARPTWRFHLIGSGGEPPHPCPPNLELLGRQPRGELAAFAANWDVAMVPFRAGPIATAADPIKTYEYLAMGLPVVVTGAAPPAGAEGLVATAAGLAELLTALEESAADVSRAAVEKRRTFAAGTTWDARLTALFASLEPRPSRP